MSARRTSSTPRGQRESSSGKLEEAGREVASGNAEAGLTTAIAVALRFALLLHPANGPVPVHHAPIFFSDALKRCLAPPKWTPPGTGHGFSQIAARPKGVPGFSACARACVCVRACARSRALKNSPLPRSPNSAQELAPYWPFHRLVNRASLRLEPRGLVSGTRPGGPGGQWGLSVNYKQHKTTLGVPKPLRIYLQVPNRKLHHYLEVNPKALGGRCRMGLGAVNAAPCVHGRRSARGAVNKRPQAAARANHRRRSAPLRAPRRVGAIHYATRSAPAPRTQGAASSAGGTIYTPHAHGAPKHMA